MLIGVEKTTLNFTISGLDYRKHGHREINLDINFDQETPEGTVNFKGSLAKEEVDFLLKFAILSLMARGALPIATATGEVSQTDLNKLN